jgi:predicted alpha/beta hydrolase
VALEWARFARSPHYMTAPDGTPLRQGFETYAGRLRAYSFSDDVRAPERCVRALHAYFTKANVEHKNVDPAALGVKSIGHVGFFFAKFKGTLWQESLAWLRGEKPAEKPAEKPLEARDKAAEAPG